MLRWLGKNIGSFLLALILAIGVWVAAVNASDPNEELIYPSPIPVETVGQATTLLITNDYDEEIKLTLRAPHSVWEKILADKESVRAVLDLSGLEAGEYSLEPQIQIAHQPTQIITVSPASIHITLEELATRTIPIEIDITGEPAIGYSAGHTSYTPKEATISGTKSLVEEVDKIYASFDINDANESIDETLSLIIQDENEQIIRDISLNPEEINLQIPISQQGGYRDVAVKVGVTGQVADYYRLTNISVFPPVVTVYSADTQLVNDMPGVVETDPVDLNDAHEDFSARVGLVLPENVTIIGDQSVLVEVSIKAILGSLTIDDKPIEIINLDPALYAQLSPTTIDVIVSGPLPALDNINPADLRVIVDVDELASGEYQLVPSVEILNDEISVESILPESIQVIISQTPFVTPTVIP